MGGVAALAVDKAPWWVIAAVAGGGTLLGVVQTVFPQESQDRLKWWQSRWRHKENGISHKANDPSGRSSGTSSSP
jgi:hypothetical protein